MLSCVEEEECVGGREVWDVPVTWGMHGSRHGTCSGSCDDIFK